MLGIKKILNRHLLNKRMDGWLSLTTSVLTAWHLEKCIQCLLCARLCSRYLGHIEADKNLSSYEEIVIIVGVTDGQEIG